jgi:hypothetical protein
MKLDVGLLIIIYGTWQQLGILDYHPVHTNFTSRMNLWTIVENGKNNGARGWAQEEVNEKLTAAERDGTFLLVPLWLTSRHFQAKPKVSTFDTEITTRGNYSFTIPFPSLILYFSKYN